MPSATALVAFVVGAVLVSLGWGRTLWYFAERSQATRRWVFFAMGYSHRQFGEVRALLLSGIYYGTGLIAALVLALSVRLQISSLFSFSTKDMLWSVLGIVGEISLSNLLIDLSVRATGMGGPARFAEMQDVPWIKGLQQLPPAAMPIAAAFGGIVEEVFFRGVVLPALMTRLGIRAPIAIAVAAVLFLVQQLIQIRTPFQALIIGCGCIAISIVGGILVAMSGSMLPALIAHGSFVLFFMPKTNKTSVVYSGKAETATS